ncbi:acyltransferase family protein [Staphylococcus lugdunensis]|uniref:acyltransferase family protein n=1 Tax=Staphylococcus lugdunensis TaxID=28035 RepID=UPI001F4CA045|nr:acyltransferase family protein [Staphylococcus lugdunensis]MCH8651102.1 acetyltransferase [Staphylococcus lugdunensis]
MLKKDLRRIDRNYKLRYMPGLDGLRAIAVLGIIIYHLNPQWLSGGFLGVDTFFVISGYLITSLLIIEYYRTGTIDLRAFWIRRIKRLIPAVYFMVSAVLVFILLFKPDLIIEIKKDAIASFLYVSNWWYISQNVDYFNQFAIAPLKHLWSLAIEEQFYVFYPIVVFFLFKRFKPQKITLILWIVSLLSLVTMAIIFGVTGDSSRVYFGTDTRLQTLLLGCILAFVWNPFGLKKTKYKMSYLGINLSGIIAFILLVSFFFIISDQDKWIYQGGFYLISAMTLFIIASAVHPSSILAKLLSFKLFTYIGKRSYSLYLWHFPIIVLMNSYYVQGQIPAYVYIIEVILMFVMAEFSYQFIENPIRKKGFKAFTFNPKHVKRIIRTVLILVFLIPTLIAFTGVFDSLGKEHEAKQHSKKTSFNTNHKKQPKPQPDQNKGQTKFNIKKSSPLLLGDSVMVDIGEVFADKVPNANIDGKVGRQLIEAAPLAKGKYQQYNKKGQIVVLELGTNGEFTKDQLKELVDAFGQADIYLVNTRVPRDYQQNNNKLMKDITKNKKNVHLVDWYSASAGHQEYFAYDGIHLEYSGCKALSNEIIKTIEQTEKEKNK